VILSANDIFKSYGDFGVLAGVSFQVREGEFVSIIGPNGAGKTTLINVLTGLLKPNKGKVFFKEHDITGIGPAKLSRLGMARSFQLVNIFPTFTVMEFIKLAVVSRQRKSARFYTLLNNDRQVAEESAEVADIFHLADKRDVEARNLPQGDKKLLDVASAEPDPDLRKALADTAAAFCEARAKGCFSGPRCSAGTWRSSNCPTSWRSASSSAIRPSATARLASCTGAGRWCRGASRISSRRPSATAIARCTPR